MEHKEKEEDLAKKLHEELSFRTDLEQAIQPSLEVLERNLLNRDPFSVRPLVPERFVLLYDEEKKLTPLDHFFTRGCQQLCVKINLGLSQGKRFIFADERFVQAQLYSLLCDDLCSVELAKQIQLEFPHALLQGFKASAQGAPRKIDIAIGRDDQNTNLILACEIKLASADQDDIFSDIARLAHLRFHGMYGQKLTDSGGSRACFFLLCGETAQVRLFDLTPRQSIKVTKTIEQAYLKHQDPSGAHDLVSECYTVLLLDTTSDSSAQFAVRLWKICNSPTPNFLVKDHKK